jgi:hypothetical protein
MFKFSHSKDTERPAHSMLSHSPVHLRDQYMVSRDDKIKKTGDSHKAVYLTSLISHYFLMGITTT